MRSRSAPLTAVARIASVTLTLGIALTACGGGGSGGGDGGAASARGEIDIWYSNNPTEVDWGEEVVAAWNAEHPSQQVSAEEIPAGKSSEEVIGAAITAGTAPCLVFNTSPAAVPGFQRQGGLVPLSDFPDGDSYIQERTGDAAEQYRSPDGGFYQLPWKSNPVMIFYNKDVFREAGIDPENPPLATHEEFLDTARRVVDSGAADFAIYPAPTSEFYQPWFDFYPLYAAESGNALLADGSATFASPEGEAVAGLWRTLYDEGLAGREPYNGDVFADGKSAMAIVGPWAIASYEESVNWGVVPVPTSSGDPEPSTFSDAKNVSMYTSCENQGTAWEFLKFATSAENDGALLETTGQMPMRDGLAGEYPDYFAAHPEYEDFADQAARTIEVPNVPNSVEIWQEFRDAWSESVIFGEKDPAEALREAAEQADELAAQ